MRTELWWSLRAASALAVLGIVGLVLATVVLENGIVRSKIEHYAFWWEKRLRFLRLDWEPMRVALILTALATLIVIGSLAVGLWAGALGGLVLGFVPPLAVERARVKRVASIDDAVEAWLSSMANALKANPSLGEALASTVKLAPSPMCDELDLTVKEYELGTPLDRALETMADRVGSRRLQGGILALKVARNAGGNLPKTLEEMGEALRELTRLEAVVRTKTAEGRMQAWVVGGLPAPLIVGVRLMDAEFLQPLFETTKGQVVGGVGLLLWAAALLLARKILAVDV